MKSQELIARVVDAQKALINKKNTGLLRDVLREVPCIENFATIITGLRRSGKSTMLLQLIKKSDEKHLYLNFEDIRLSGFETSDFIRLNNEIEQRKVTFLYFDEIQLTNQWEIFVNQKLNEGYHVLITGSNASLLSRELGTHLTGRHLTTELFPFSFNEFTNYKKRDKSLKSFDTYLKLGGMPEYLKSNSGNILRQMVDDILHRDIAVRHNIRNVNALRELTVFLISNIGKPIAARRLNGLFGLNSTTTFTDYFSYLQDAYIVDFLPQFDYSLKAQSRNPKKVYAIDLGIYHQINTSFTDDLGRQLENAVYLHLRRHYTELYYFNKNAECDFVVMKDNKPLMCVQTCYHFDDMNMQRELNGLKIALEYFDLKEGVIVTHHQTDHFEIDGKTITLVPAWKYVEG